MRGLIPGYLFITCVVWIAGGFVVDINTGSDNNDGLTPSTAFKTINKCISQLINPGDACEIAHGRYREVIEINGLRGTADKPFEIKGLGDDRPIWDGTVVIEPSKWDFDADTGICSAIINQDITALFLNYRLLTSARWPNALWSDKSCFDSSYWGKSDGASTRDTMVDNGEAGLATSGINATGAMAILNIGRFNTFVGEVLQHTPGTSSFSYDNHFGDHVFRPKVNQYYLEAAFSLLDAPEEWYYDMNSKVLYLIPPAGSSCPIPGVDVLRGRVIDYSLTIRNTTGLKVSNMTFFASTIDASSEYVGLNLPVTYIDHITLHSIEVLFGASSHRMLKSDKKPKWTRVFAHVERDDGKLKWLNGKISVINCTFHGSEGAGLEYAGEGVYIHNNYFSWNDWTGHLMEEACGGKGTVIGWTDGEEFTRNTLWYNGASAGIRPGHGDISYNRIAGQGNGEIMHDGAAIQFEPLKQAGAYATHNWMHDSPKFSCRFDASPNSPVRGEDGTMMFNVAWNTLAYMIVGDNHTIMNNLALRREGAEGPGCDLCVIYMLPYYSDIHNNHSIVLNNGASRADGGYNKAGDRYPLGGGVIENNYSGENADQNLYDPKHLDFRPLENSNFTKDEIIGPYLPGIQKSYWIAGRKLYKTSTPIPPSGTTVLWSRDVVMFLGGFQADQYHWYFGDDKTLVEEATVDDAEYQGVVEEDRNVLVLPKLDAGAIYYWRVDTQWGGYTYKGDLWSFTTK